MATIKTALKNMTMEGAPLSQEAFVSMIKEAEKGPFKPIGTFEEFKKDILASWKKRHSK